MGKKSKKVSNKTKKIPMKAKSTIGKKTRNTVEIKEKTQENVVDSDKDLQLSCGELISTAKALIELGSFEGGIELLENALESIAHSGSNLTEETRQHQQTAMILLAESYTQLKETSKAIEYYEKVLVTSPKDWETLFQVAIMYEDEENYEKAIEYFRKCTENEDTEYLDMVLAAFANCMGKRGDISGALGVFSDAVQRFPQNAKYHYNLATMQLANEDAESAVESYRRSISLDPEHLDTYEDLVEALNGLDRTTESKEICEKLEILRKQIKLK